MSAHVRGQIVVERILPQSPDVVFSAFADEQSIAAWIAPDSSIALSVDVFTFAPDGRYRFRFHMPDGVELPLEGTFLSIARPDRLRFSWQWQPPDIHAGIETLVDVQFDEIDTGTRLTLTHSRLDAANMTARHEGGWHASLSRLDDWLTNQDISK